MSSTQTKANYSFRSKKLHLITLAALGVVFGDIGTSPLYALKECFNIEHGIPFSPAAVPGTSRFVIPLTLIILVILFLIQRHGTTVVGKLFGPVMLVWFVSLGVVGIFNIVKAPEVLLAINPIYAVHFMTTHSLQAFVVLGSVVLVLTGAEALYADMGHFGIRPIRFAWLYTVMPCLLINYFGQGANLLINPAAVDNPFYRMVPDLLLVPMVNLATFATVIASQAVISGAFSLTSQAILLGFVPRMRIQHTSADERGQIYIPLINWMLLVLVVAVVLAFKKSDNLAAAYGVAVTTTMVITTILAAVVMRIEWKWHPVLVTLVIGAFFIVDFAFFAANLLKIADGGWFPLLLGGAAFFLLMTWYSGRMLLRMRIKDDGIPLEPFIEGLLAHPPHRVGGTAVFMTGNINTVPVALLHNLKHNRILHERVFFLKISIWDVPYVSNENRLTLKDMGGNVYLLRAAFGFKEAPEVNKVLDLTAAQFNMEFDLMDTSFFLARDTVVPSKLLGMSLWREQLFAWMYQNGAKPSDFFHIPANRVVELGTKVEI